MSLKSSMDTWPLEVRLIKAKSLNNLDAEFVTFLRSSPHRVSRIPNPLFQSLRMILVCFHEKNKRDLCLVHVIWTERRMTNLVLNVCSTNYQTLSFLG